MNSFTRVNHSSVPSNRNYIFNVRLRYASGILFDNVCMVCID